MAVARLPTNKKNHSGICMTLNCPRPEPRSRRTPRQQRSKMTVDAILQAAAILFARDGFKKTSTTRIAELAGVSVGSLYEYFSNKDGLLAYLIKRHCDWMLEHVAQRLRASQDCQVMTALAVFVDSIHESYAMNMPLQRVLIEHLGRLSKPHHFERVSGALISVLEEHLQERGQAVPRPDVRQALYVVECIVESLIHRSILFDPHFFHDKLRGELLNVSASCLGLPAGRN